MSAMPVATIILFIVMQIPGEKQPAVHRQEMASIEECMAEAAAILHEAAEQKKLLQAGCITVPGRNI